MAGVRAWGVVGAVLVLLVCAGCSGEGGDSAVNPADVVYGTASAEPSARPSYDNIPPENVGLEPPSLEDYPGVYEDTPEGAQDAFEFFVMAHQYAYATGDTGPMESMFTPEECEGCEWLVDKIHEEAEIGTFVVYDSFEISRVEVKGQEPKGLAIYLEGKRKGIVLHDLGNARSESVDDSYKALGVFEFDGEQWVVKLIDAYFS